MELLGECFSCSRETIPLTSLYEYIVGKLNDRYGPGSYNVESLQSKFQRMKVYYKIYCGVSTNIGLGWDEETQTINCPNHFVKDYVKVIFTQWSCTFCYFIILFDFFTYIGLWFNFNHSFIFQWCKKTKKIIKEGLPNFDLYKMMYSKCTAMGFMATALGGRRPQNSHMLIEESDEDGDEWHDLGAARSTFRG